MTNHLPVSGIIQEVIPANEWIEEFRLSTDLPTLKAFADELFSSEDWAKFVFEYASREYHTSVRRQKSNQPIYITNAVELVKLVIKELMSECAHCGIELNPDEVLELETGETVCGACETKYLIKNYK